MNIFQRFREKSALAHGPAISGGGVGGEGIKYRTQFSTVELVAVGKSRKCVGKLSEKFRGISPLSGGFALERRRYVKIRIN